MWAEFRRRSDGDVMKKLSLGQLGFGPANALTADAGQGHDVHAK